MYQWLLKFTSWSSIEVTVGHSLQKSLAKIGIKFLIFNLVSLLKYVRKWAVEWKLLNKSIRGFVRLKFQNSIFWISIQKQNTLKPIFSRDGVVVLNVHSFLKDTKYLWDKNIIVLLATTPMNCNKLFCTKNDLKQATNCRYSHQLVFLIAEGYMAEIHCWNNNAA